MSVVLLLLFVALAIGIGIWRQRKIAAVREGKVIRTKAAPSWRGIFVHPGHAWVEVVEPALVAVGTDEFTKSVFGMVERLTLPEPGRVIQQGGNAWKLKRGRRELVQTSPISGRVEEVNQDLVQNPGLLVQNDTEKNWMLRIRPLRNFIRCPKCGQKLTGGWSTGRKKVRYAYYHCRTQGCSLCVRKEDLETKFYEYLKSFQPNEDTLALFEAVILDVWKTKQTERIKEQCRLEKELKALEEKRDRIDELLIKGTFDEDTYKRKSEELKNEILVRKIELNEEKIELNDIEACIYYCKLFRANIADLWTNADLALKQRFQILIFPEKICYEGESFKTARTALIFKGLQAKNLAESSLASLTRFELVSPP